MFNSGWSLGRTGGSVTSNAAAFITPFCNATVRSSWLTVPPRPTLISVAVDFIILSSSAEMKLVVSGVNGKLRTTKSDAVKSSFNSKQNVAPEFYGEKKKK